MKRALVVVFGLLVASPVWANAPAPWWSCDELDEGDECGLYGGGTGVCEVQADCNDDPDTDVDECVYCVEGEPEGGCAATSGGSALLLVAALALRRKKSA